MSEARSHDLGAARNASRRVWVRAIIVFAAAFFIRLVYLYQIWDVPFMHVPTVDARAYDEWGQAIAGGDWWGDKVFYQAPLYPYLVGVVYSIFGRSLPALHLLQLLIGAATCSLAYLAGRRFFNETAGLISGGILAVYPPALFFDGIMHKEGVALFLLMLTILLLTLAVDIASRRAFIAAGVVCGLLALTRENMLILMPVVPGWMLLRKGLPGIKSRAIPAAVFLLGAALVLLPVATRNYMVGSTFAVTSYNFGPNFFFGNNPDATGVYEPLVHSRQDPMYERADAERLAEQRLGRDLKAGEVSSYWFKQGMRFIAEQPLAWSRLTARKILLTWNRFEVPDTEDLHLYAESSLILGSLRPVLHFGVLAPLGLAGMVFAWRERQRVALLYVLIVAITASVAIFFVFARYRYPLVAPLVLFAGFAIAETARVLGEQQPKKLLVPIAFAAISAVAINRSMLPEEAYRSVAYVNLASLYSEAGQRDFAVASAERALQLYPDNALAHLHLGRLLAGNGSTQEAEAHLSRAVALDPTLHLAHGALADLYETAGRQNDAALQLRKALALSPDDARLHLRLARLLLRLNARDEASHELSIASGLSPGILDELSTEEQTLLAEAHAAETDILVRARRALSAGEYGAAIGLYEQALTARADDASLHYELATALAAVNDRQRAQAHFERAITIAPNFAAAHNDLGQLLTEAGSFDSAIEHYRAAIGTAPRMIPAHYNLATTLAAAGRLDEAATAMEQCLTVARQHGTPDVIARVEDRLTRLRAEARRQQD